MALALVGRQGRDERHEGSLNMGRPDTAYGLLWAAVAAVKLLKYQSVSEISAIFHLKIFVALASKTRQLRNISLIAEERVS